jgi:hypothetical protein
MNVYLVDIKNEYTNHLIKLLTPLIYEGIQSVYDKAKDCMEDQSLKLFQEYLRAIPDWNNNILETETTRIKNGSKIYLEQLIKATIKANVLLLSFNPFKPEKPIINKNIYANINLTGFLHKIYIECAREFWNNPYLFYHNYSPVDTKRNQRDSINVIKECIREAIRRLLPIEDVLKIYLADDITPDKEKQIGDNLTNFTEDKIPNTTGFTEMYDKKINATETTYNNVNNPRDNNVNNATDNNATDNNVTDNNATDNNATDNNATDNNATDNNATDNNATDNNATDNNATDNNVNNDIGDKKMEKMIGGKYSATSASLLDKIEMKINSNQSNTELVNNKQNFDTKIEDILGDTDIDTSLNYSIENNLNNYQEIYGNN